MTAWNPDRFPERIRPLLSRPTLPDLGPGEPREEVRPLLAGLKTEDVAPSHRDRDMALCCLSGLWLLHDFLDESHSISQEIHTSTGSYLHAVMHRREPDAWNSNYWWAKVGSHPVLDQLRTEAPELGYTFTNPSEFVDLCEKVRGRGDAYEELAKQVQLLEWRLLFDHCYRMAIG
jgi:hypothetical protein